MKLSSFYPLACIENLKEGVPLSPACHDFLNRGNISLSLSFGFVNVGRDYFPIEIEKEINAFLLETGRNIRLGTNAEALISIKEKKHPEFFIVLGGCEVDRCLYWREDNFRVRIFTESPLPSHYEILVVER